MQSRSYPLRLRAQYAMLRRPRDHLNEGKEEVKSQVEKMKINVDLDVEKKFVKMKKWMTRTQKQENRGTAWRVTH